MKAYYVKVLLASVAFGAAIPEPTSSNDCVIPLPLGSLVISQLPFSISLPLKTQPTRTLNKRDIELENEEYMVSWWSSEDEVNRNSYSELESSLDEMTELILADSETSIQSSSHTCPDDAHSSSSGYYHESRPLSIIEESEPPLEAAPAAAPSNIIVGNPAAENRVCSTGMMRCTDDKRGFDTCLYGKWGTVRTCAQGTTCMAVAGDSIACGLE